MKLIARELECRFLRLELLGTTHQHELREACNADRATWNELYPYSMADEHFDPMWERVMGDIGGGRTIAHAVVVGGVCVGITCFSALDPINASLEIGGTYYRPEFRGGSVNPAAKRLMLSHAFDAGARRVVFRVDAINARSRAAVLKIGATEEALLRKDRVTWTGRIRDTVIFSILADEWPSVRDRLDARLAAFA